MTTQPSHPSTVFMFSGQGSHYYRMGEALYRQHPVFRKTLQELDEQAQLLLGESIIAVLYDDRRKKLDSFSDIRYTHPAIFMVEVALVRTLQHEGIKADYVLGASLGAFAAVTVAGGLAADQALTAVIRQADAIARHCTKGHMLAVLDSPSLYHQLLALRENSTLAAIHFDQHFVIATDDAGLQIVEEALDQQKTPVTRQRLAVNYAFHSHWLDPAADAYLAFARAQSIKPLSVPFICCASAKISKEVAGTDLWQAVRCPIEFQKTVTALEAQGNWRYIDAGPSGTLATFLKYLISSASGSSIHALITPYGQEMNDLRKLVQTAGLSTP